MNFLPQRMYDTYTEPKVKMSGDRLDLIVTQDRKNRMTRVTIDIEEKRGKMEMLVYDLINECEDTKETRPKKRERKSNTDRKLETAPQKIKLRASEHITSKSTDTIHEKGKIMKKQRVVKLNLEDEELEILRKWLTERCNIDREKMKLDRELFEIEHQNVLDARERRREEKSWSRGTRRWKKGS